MSLEEAEGKEVRLPELLRQCHRNLNLSVPSPTPFPFLAGTSCLDWLVLHTQISPALHSECGHVMLPQGDHHLWGSAGKEEKVADYHTMRLPLIASGTPESQRQVN